MSVLRKLMRDPVAAVALCLAVLIVLAAVAAPLIMPGDPADNDLSLAMQPPGQGLLLGADDQGRDMVLRLLYGLRLTLLIGAAAVVLGGGVGAVLGLLAAFYRPLDAVVMRLMDVLLAFPAILFGLAIAAIGPATRHMSLTAKRHRAVAAGPGLDVDASAILEHRCPSPGSVLLLRQDRHDPAAAAGLEVDRARRLGEQGVVLPFTHAVAGLEAGPALAHDDLAAADGLAGEDLHAQALSL